LAGEFIGVLSAFGDGEVLSAFGATAAGASLPFVPAPWANAKPVPAINAKAATELKSEFFMWLSSMAEPTIRFDGQ
jgi:hypothetical protein